MNLDSKHLIFTVIAVIVLVGTFYLLKPKSLEAPGDSAWQQPTATQSPASTAKNFVLTIENSKIVSGPTTLNAVQDDSISIKITSDVDEEFHLHAYDKVVELKAGKQANIDFVADLSGRFPFELEKSKVELGALEVQPK